MIKVMREINIDNRYCVQLFVDKKKAIEISNMDIEGVKDYLNVEGIGDDTISQAVALVRFTKYPAVLEKGRLLGVVK